MRDPTRDPRALGCSLLIITSYGAPCHVAIEVRKSDFRKLRRCRREDVHVISLNLAAATVPLNYPDDERRGVVTPIPLGRPAYSRSSRRDTNA